MSKSLYKAVWGRTFAFLYDTAFVLAEKRGLNQIRLELLSRASGKVVELGAGTGLNLAHYPALVEKLLLTEPDPERTIREISRLLRSNGRLIFAEHVRSENRKIAWLQDKLNTS